MAAAILPRFKHKLSGLVLVPSDGGRFEISLDGAPVYSKLETGKFPDHGEIIKQIESRLG